MTPSLGVPPDYRGVWVRTGPANGTSQDTPWSRWLQTSHWQAHLCVPPQALWQREPLPLPALTTDQLAALTHQRAHLGRAQVEAHPEGELLTWVHQADYQPPAATPDVAWMVFTAPDRLMRVHLHSEETQVWQRLPDSVGRFRCLAGQDDQGQDDGRRLLMAGAYAMRMQLRPFTWPRGMRAGLSLAEAMMHRPDQALHWLDQEFSFGRFEQEGWTVERSTLPACEGQCHRVRWVRDGDDPAQAWGELDGRTERWRVLEWSDL